MYKRQNEEILERNYNLLRRQLSQNKKFGRMFAAIEKARLVKRLVMDLGIEPLNAFIKTLGKGGWWSMPLAIAAKAVTAGGIYSALSSARGMAEGGMVSGNPNLGDAYLRRLTAGETVVPQKNYEDLKRGIIANADEPMMGTREEVVIDLSDDAGKLFEIAERNREGLGY